MGYLNELQQPSAVNHYTGAVETNLDLNDGPELSRNYRRLGRETLGNIGKTALVTLGAEALLVAANHYVLHLTEDQRAWFAQHIALTGTMWTGFEALSFPFRKRKIEDDIYKETRLMSDANKIRTYRLQAELLDSQKASEGKITNLSGQATDTFAERAMGIRTELAKAKHDVSGRAYWLTKLVILGGQHVMSSYNDDLVFDQNIKAALGAADEATETVGNICHSLGLPKPNAYEIIASAFEQAAGENEKYIDSPKEYAMIAHVARKAYSKRVSYAD